MECIYIFICLIVSVSVKAQYAVGFNGGISIPKLQGNSEQSKGYTSRSGVYAGLLASIKLSKLFYLQPEVNISPQGGHRNGLQSIPSDAVAGIQLPPGTSLYARYNNQTILNYIEIPILVKIKLGRKLVYYGCFGPHIAFLIEAKTKTNGSSLLYLDQEGMIPLSENGSPLPPFSFNNAANIKESIKKFNAGAQDGIGCAYQFKNANVFFEGRTVIGLTNIQAHPDTDGKNQTGSLIVAAGYMIYIK